MSSEAVRATAASLSLSFFGPRGVLVGVHTHMGDMTALSVRLDGDCPLGLGEIAVPRVFDRAGVIPSVDTTDGFATRRVKA